MHGPAAEEPHEWLWHVSREDVPLGRVERSRAHDEQLRHRSGIVFLLDADARVYITHRAASKKLWPSCHDASASFHVEYRETYAQAAEREAFEELGLSAPPEWIGAFHHDDPPELQWVGVFLMRHSGAPIKLDLHEASYGSFLAIPDVIRRAKTEPCTPWLRDGLTLLCTFLRERSNEPLTEHAHAREFER